MNVRRTTPWIALAAAACVTPLGMKPLENLARFSRVEIVPTVG